MIERIGKRAGACGCMSVAAALNECGVSYVFAVSGAPATDLARELEARIINFEWSLNEKVAAEAAVGVSAAGGRSALVMKQCGLNVALDPLINAVYHGIGGGVVVFVGDDTHAKSSTVLQDSRFLALVAGMPVLELSWRCDINIVTDHAYELSEEASIPVIVRFREDLHAREVDRERRAELQVSVLHTGTSREVDRRVAHQLTKLGRYQYHRISKWPMVKDYVDHCGLVREQHNGKCGIGVIVVGGSGDIADGLLENVCILETDVSWPIPLAITDFLRSHEKVVVLEEPLPFLERELRVECGGSRDNWKVLGRMTGDLPPEGPVGSLDSLVGEDRVRRPSGDFRTVEMKRGQQSGGLPYASLFEAIAQLSAEGWFVSVDIGSAVKLCYPPYEAATVALCLGSPIGVSAGHARQSGKSAIAVIGDYGLLHSGLEGVMEMVHRDIPGLIVVLANGVAMQTGGQSTVAGKEVERPVSLRNVLRGAGVRRIDSWDVDSVTAADQLVRLRKCLTSGEVCVALVSQGKGIAS